MDIEQRLKETSDDCLKSFKAWNDNKKSADNREALQDAIHELRKVASRMEIELAISERNENAQKPIPIPPHRDAKKKGSHEENSGGNGGNGNGDNAPQKKGGRKPRKASGGGGAKNQDDQGNS